MSYELLKMKKFHPYIILRDENPESCKPSITKAITLFLAGLSQNQACFSFVVSTWTLRCSDNVDTAAID